MTKNEVILEPPTIKQDKNPNYNYDLFGDNFIYCGIHLSTNGLKENGKPKKHQFFLINMIKLKNHLLRIGPVKINYINLMVLLF